MRPGSRTSVEDPRARPERARHPHRGPVRELDRNDPIGRIAGEIATWTDCGDGTRMTSESWGHLYMRAIYIWSDAMKNFRFRRLALQQQAKPDHQCGGPSLGPTYSRGYGSPLVCNLPSCDWCRRNVPPKVLGTGPISIQCSSGCLENAHHFGPRGRFLCDPCFKKETLIMTKPTKSLSSIFAPFAKEQPDFMGRIAQAVSEAGWDLDLGPMTPDVDARMDEIDAKIDAERKTRRG